MMKINDLISKLSEDARLTSKYADKPGNPQWIKIWVRDNFCCVYCGDNLLRDVVHMNSAQLDHILPKSKYKDYADKDSNLVLSCYCCNQIKRAFDPLGKLSDQVKTNISPKTFDKYRDELLSVCRNYILPFLNKKKIMLNKSNDIINRIDERYIVTSEKVTC